MHTKTIAELVIELREKKISSQELVQHYLNRIKKYEPQLNAFVTVLQEDVLNEEAKKADELRAQGHAKLLTGIPIAQKDLFCTKGVRSSCGSKMLDNFIAPYDATVVRQCQDAGMILMGKTNMDEFAMGSSNETSFYGAAFNPWDLERVPGGSSGGSAAAVAGRLVPVATGTDTGGSIRQPAAFTGVTGLKPTYGSVSRYGLIAFASSLDQGGPMTLSAEDAAIMMNVMSGFDPLDSTSVEREYGDFTQHLNRSLSGLKIGIPEEYFGPGLDPAVGAVVQEAIKEYEKMGAKIRSVHLPNNALALPAYYVIAPAECSSNLARFDGVRYGYRCENPKDLMDMYCRSRAEGFGAEVKRRVMIGTYVLSSGHYEALYNKAQCVRRLVQNDFNTAFEEVDIILGPTTPNVAFKKGEKVNDPVSMYLSDVYTVGVNLAGLPGLSIPAGFAHGLPVGMQLVGNYFSEDRLLNVGHQYQQVTDWHKRMPAHV
ncbi:MAG: Asp-tRNA(Asn)/Glu-tRNA(Gln) amidotransferase subunit GatA [Gammaproteobacteria bacterium]|nr:Asp-tRNA(Asn)/Glu-tRNA(Gln) amidotransferase subunit GatA [Gammaproteobacteria bacterium]